MVDEVEQTVVGPVEILEHEHERPLFRGRLEEATPGGERLVAFRTLRRFESGQWSRMTGEPLAFALVLNEAGNCLDELCLCLLQRVGVEDAGMRLDDFSERPVGDALPIGERSALPP